MQDWAVELQGAVWLAWFLFYRFATRSALPDEERESAWSRASYIVPMLGTVALFVWLGWPGWLGQRLIPWGLAIYWAGTALTIAGLGLTTWARAALGANWSGTVSVKAGHQLVRTGPYRWIRHPMYGGVLVALLGTALAFGLAHDVAGLLIAVLALTYKLRIEERWMARAFGNDYAAYRAATQALVPFLF